MCDAKKHIISVLKETVGLNDLLINDILSRHEQEMNSEEPAYEDTWQAFSERNKMAGPLTPKPKNITSDLYNIFATHGLVLHRGVEFHPDLNTRVTQRNHNKLIQCAVSRLSHFTITLRNNSY